MKEVTKGILIGAFLMFVILNLIQTFYSEEKAIAEIESFLNLENLPYTITNRINENSTIKDIRNWYYTFPNISRFILKEKIKSICGG